MSSRASIRSASWASRAWWPGSGRGHRWLMLLGLLCLGGHAARGAGPEVSKEYQIKAAYLYNFTKFVEWPARCFADGASPIVIAILGENPFGEELEKLVKGRKVNGREIVVKQINSVAEAATVHLLFVTGSNERYLWAALPILRAAGVLTVGESAQFGAGGGMINFIISEDKVRFEINRTSSGLAELKISAQLLKLATSVRS